MNLDKFEEYINNLSKEELSKILEESNEQYEKSWLPENQNSFYSCWYCGKDGHAVLCKDGAGRGFCPECRDRVEKEWLDY